MNEPPITAILGANYDRGVDATSALPPIEEAKLFYFASGVRDVLVADRRSGEAHCWSPEGNRVAPSSPEIRLTGGCVSTL